jgi:sugar O-acyltransferase (sialic acid O-acetyltransferase NeuD family)
MKAFIFGAGSHGRVTLDILKAQGGYEIIEFIDENEDLWKSKINNSLVAGGLEYLDKQDKRNCKVVVALGNCDTRLIVVEKIKEMSISFFNAIHPSAIITDSAILGEGNIIGANVIVNSNAKIGNHIILNNNAIIEHDTIIEDGANISPMVLIGGRVVIKEKAFLGMGSVIMPRISIGRKSVVGGGSVVTRNVPEEVMVLGSPARILLKIDKNFDWGKLL